MGQQITVENLASAGIERVSLLLERADTRFISTMLGGSTTEIDVVARCMVDGQPRGFVYDDGRFISDRGTLMWKWGFFFKV